jgi:hypothetical protein
MTEGMSEIHRALGRVEGKIDNMLIQMKAHDDRTTDLEVRTRKVENKQYWISGLGSAVGAIVGLLTGHGFRLPQ